MLRFIKTTVLGGILFLIPVVILLIIYQQADRIISKLADPILAALPFRRVFGIAVTDLLSIIVLVVICFVAGLVAMTPVAKKFAHAAETMFLSKIPTYDVAKIKLSTPLRFEEAGNLQPLLLRLDDQWQIGLEIERFDDKVVAYLPGSPDPWSGTVAIVAADRVSTLEADTQTVMVMFKQLGKGIGKLLS